MGHLLLISITLIMVNVARFLLEEQFLLQSRRNPQGNAHEAAATFFQPRARRNPRQLEGRDRRIHKLLLLGRVEPLQLLEAS